MDNQQGNLQWWHLMDQYLESVAYSVGALLGDGSVKTHLCRKGDGFQETKAVVIANIDFECIGRVCEEVNRFFSADYEVAKFYNPNGTLMYRLAINNTNVYELFHYFVGEKLNIPDEVFRAPREVRVNFLCGLFDTDGYIAANNNSNSKHGISYRIGYAARTRTLVEDVTRLLQKLGVKVGQIHEQTSGHGTKMYVIKPNIRSFLDAGCHFFIHRKMSRLLDYQKDTRYQRPVIPSETIMPGLHR